MWEYIHFAIQLKWKPVDWIWECVCVYLFCPHLEKWIVWILLVNECILLDWMCLCIHLANANFYFSAQIFFFRYRFFYIFFSSFFLSRSLLENVWTIWIHITDMVFRTYLACCCNASHEIEKKKHKIILSTWKLKCLRKSWTSEQCKFCSFRIF